MKERLGDRPGAAQAPEHRRTALSDDSGRFFTAQPIQVRPPSAAYQLRKLVARNELATAAHTPAEQENRPSSCGKLSPTVHSSVKRSGVLGMLEALWVFRKFVFGMVSREFRGRYLGSLLGGMWAILTPLATILIYLIVFSAVMRGKLPSAASAQGDSLSYGLFLCTGILVWGFFAEVVGRCQVVFVESANLLKKMSFPRITLPVIVLLSAALNFLLVAIVFVILLLVVERFPGEAMLAFLPLLVVQQGFAVGLGILLGTLHVFFRDVGQFWAVLLNLWFWSTPIVYPIAILPENVRDVLAWNPLTPLFLSYQQIVLDNAWPAWGDLGLPLGAALLFAVAGLLVFRKLSGEMVDEL